MEKVISLPADVKYLLNRLSDNGYEAFVVGGCVRDSLMGITPHDWDICTNALVSDMQRVFSDCRLIPTGIKHGTLSVFLNDTIYEITTYRVDGEYEDNRHPKSVTFVSDLRSDLLRRDFTINAMAYNETSGLIDLFGGVEDIKNGVIRCVGNAEDRFSEDALRIMRAVRFALRYDFDIEDSTREAMYNKIKLLKVISVERVASELEKSLSYSFNNKNNKNCVKYLIDCLETVLCYSNYNQNSDEVFLRLNQSTNNLYVRLAVLFGASALESLKALKFSNEIINGVCEIVNLGYEVRSVVVSNLYLHKTPMERRYFCRKFLGKVKYSDWVDVVEFTKLTLFNDGHVKVLEELISCVELCIDDKDAIRLSDLTINGDDLKKVGFVGVELGCELNKILNMIMLGELENSRESIMKFATLDKRGDL